MNWYYMRLGKDLQHGIVNDEELHSMAAAGGLSRNDLIWGEEGGSGWVQADSLHGLFPEEKEKVQLGVNREDEIHAQQQAAAVQNVQKVQAEKQSKKKSSSGVVIMILVCAAAALLHFRDDIMGLINPEAPEAGLVEDAATDEAIEDPPPEPPKPQGLVRLEELTGRLSSGELDSSEAKELLDLWFEHSDLGALPGILTGILDTEGAVPENVILSVMHVGAVLNDSDVMIKAAKGYKDGLRRGSSPDICAQFAGVCAEKEVDNGGAGILEAYLRKNPKSAMAWFELAALQAGRDREKAFDALKSAVKVGGNDIKQKAVADERFDVLNSSSEFQKITGD